MSTVATGLDRFALIRTLQESLPVAANGMASATIGSRVYLFGGVGSSGYISAIRIFDAETETITTLDITLPEAACGMASATIGSRVYLFGGVGSSGYISAIWVFDAETETITTLDLTLPEAASEMASATIGSRVYFFGGFGSSGMMSTICVFDTEASTITTLDVMYPEWPRAIAAAAVGTKIYLFGGYGHNGHISAIRVFDAEADTITTLDIELPIKAYAIAAATVGTKIYLFGGYGYGSTALQSINVFETATETITTLDVKLPSRASYITSAAVGSNIYLFGGCAGKTRYKTINLLYHSSLANKLSYLAETKEQLKSAITSKGVDIDEGTTFRGYSEAIGKIETSQECLNIAYGDTAPEDTNKLWVKSGSKSNVVIQTEVSGAPRHFPYGAIPATASDIITAAVGSKVYLFGSIYISGYRYIQVYDPDTASFTQLSAKLPSTSGTFKYPIIPTSAAVIGSKIYLFGCQNGGYPMTNIYEFDTETSVLKLLSVSLPVAAKNIGTAVVGTKVYLFGGHIRGDETIYQTTVNVFDPDELSVVTLEAQIPALSDGAQRSVGMAAAAVGTKVYLFGGNLDSNMEPVLVFDTETESFEDLGVAYEGDDYASAVAVGSNIYIVDRYSDGYIRIFDPQAKTFAIACSTPNANPGVTVIGSDIYLFGGSARAINVYNTETNVISGPARIESGLGTFSLESTAEFAAVASVGTKTYRFGGSKSDASSNYASIEVFDTEKGTFSVLNAVLPTAVRLASAAAIGSKIYLFGGASSDTPDLNTISVFDADTETVATLEVTLPVLLKNAAAVSIGSKIYLFGGRCYDAEGEFEGVVKTIYEFDSSTDTVRKLACELPRAAYGITTAVVGKKIYLFGGTGVSGDSLVYLSGIRVFDSETETVAELGYLSRAICSVGGAAVDGNRIYVFGGKSDYYTYSQTVDVFNVKTGTVQTMSNALASGMAVAGVHVVNGEVYACTGSGIYKMDFRKLVADDELRICAGAGGKPVTLLEGNAVTLDIEVEAVYSGNENGLTREVEAYCHKDGEWTLI